MKQKKNHISGIKRLLTPSRMLYLFVLFILIFETTAVALLKEYSLSHNIYALLMGIICYMLVSIFLAQSFRFEDMGVVNILWSAYSVILVVATGVLLFDEKLGLKEGVGMMLVMTGVVIVRWHGRSKPSLTSMPTMAADVTALRS